MSVPDYFFSSWKVLLSYQLKAKKNYSSSPLSLSQFGLWEKIKKQMDKQNNKWNLWGKKEAKKYNKKKQKCSRTMAWTCCAMLPPSMWIFVLVFLSIKAQLKCFIYFLPFFSTIHFEGSSLFYAFLLYSTFLYI
jgi:hypothetical protein